MKNRPPSLQRMLEGIHRDGVGCRRFWRAEEPSNTAVDAVPVLDKIDVGQSSKIVIETSPICPARC